MLKMAYFLQKLLYEVICHAPNQRFNKTRIQLMQYVMRLLLLLR